MEMPEMPGLVGENLAPEAPEPEEEMVEETNVEAPTPETIVAKAKEAVEEAKLHADDAAQLAAQVPEAKTQADEAAAAADEAAEAFIAVEEAASAAAAVDPEDLNAARDAGKAVEEAAGPVFEALQRAMNACEEIRTMIPQSKTAEPGLGAALMEWASQTIQGGD